MPDHLRQLVPPDDASVLLRQPRAALLVQDHDVVAQRGVPLSAAEQRDGRGQLLAGLLRERFHPGEDLDPLLGDAAFLLPALRHPVPPPASPLRTRICTRQGGRIWGLYATRPAGRSSASSASLQVRRQLLCAPFRRRCKGGYSPPPCEK